MTYAVTVGADAITLQMTFEKVTFTVGCSPLTLQKLPMQLAFSRKPADLSEVCGGELCTVYVYRRVDMDPMGFDHFARTLIRDADWLDGPCPSLPIADARACIMVVATGRPVLFVDTEGACYARYVGRLG